VAVHVVEVAGLAEPGDAETAGRHVVDPCQRIANAKEFAENPIGTFFDPEKLVAAREEGLSFQEIHERTRARSPRKTSSCPRSGNTLADHGDHC
jgi:hypothetical protein